MSPPYPLSPTRCWRYHFSYLDSGGDCGLGRCKRPAEARCLPPSQSPRLGSRKLNPLLDSHMEKLRKKKPKKTYNEGKGLDQWKRGVCPLHGLADEAVKAGKEDVARRGLKLNPLWQCRLMGLEAKHKVQAFITLRRSSFALSDWFDCAISFAHPTSTKTHGG